MVHLKRTAFSLIEIVTVITILAILASVAIISYAKYKDRTNVETAQRLLAGAAEDIISIYAEEDTFPSSIIINGTPVFPTPTAISNSVINYASYTTSTNATTPYFIVTGYVNSLSPALSGSKCQAQPNGSCSYVPQGTQAGQFNQISYAGLLGTNGEWQIFCGALGDNLADDSTDIPTEYYPVNCQNTNLSNVITAKLPNQSPGSPPTAAPPPLNPPSASPPPTCSSCSNCSQTNNWCNINSCTCMTCNTAAQWTSPSSFPAPTMTPSPAPTSCTCAQGYLSCSGNNCACCTTGQYSCYSANGTFNPANCSCCSSGNFSCSPSGKCSCCPLGQVYTPSTSCNGCAAGTIGYACCAPGGTVTCNQLTTLTCGCTPPTP